MIKEEKLAEQYAEKECCKTCHNINHFCKEKCECWNFAKKGFIAGLKAKTQWHNIDEEPIPTDGNWDNEFVIRLKNGNKRIVYSSCGRLKDRINGEHIPTDIIMLWIQLPKEK